MNRSLIALLPLVLILSSCWEGDEPTAGTNDETTTALQVLADNVRDADDLFQGASEPTQAPLVARRADGLLAEGWRPDHIEDHGTWASWMLLRRRMPEESGCSEPVEDVLQNDFDGWRSSTAHCFKLPDGADSGGVVQSFRTRSGFAWQSVITGRTDPLDAGRSIVRVILDFPQLGMRVEVPRFDTLKSPRLESLQKELLRGLPLLSGARVVGRLSIDSATNRFRWFDLQGKEYLPRSLPFRQTLEDSIGLRLVSFAPDTIGSAPGWRVDGRFHLPDSFGLVAEGIRVTWEGAEDAVSSSSPSPVVDCPVTPLRGRLSLFCPETPIEPIGGESSDRPGPTKWKVRIETRLFDADSFAQGVRLERGGPVKSAFLPVVAP